MFRVICVLIGYAFGCIQTAYIVGRIMRNIDIRQHGSGNAGTTNTVRVVGRMAGLIVFVSDILKAITAFTVCSLIFGGSGSFVSGDAGILPGLYAGLGVILGHNFPVVMNFKGGKGVASALGLMLCVNLPAALCTYVCGFTLLLIFKYISLCSLVMVLLFPAVLLFFAFNIEASVILFLITALTYFMHRGNIKRLIDGNENKFSLKKKTA